MTSSKHIIESIEHVSYHTSPAILSPLFLFISSFAIYLLRFVLIWTYQRIKIVKWKIKIVREETNDLSIYYLHLVRLINNR